MVCTASVQTLPRQSDGWGKDYIVYAGKNGKLLEINDELLKNPSFLQTKSEGAGYVAVIQKSAMHKNAEFGGRTLEKYCEVRGLQVPKYIPLPVANEEYDIDEYN